MDTLDYSESCSLSLFNHSLYQIWHKLVQVKSMRLLQNVLKASDRIFVLVIFECFTINFKDSFMDGFKASLQDFHASVEH